MSALGMLLDDARRLSGALAQRVFTLTHHGLALLGVGLLSVVLLLTARPEWRQVGEIKLFGWLQERQVELTGMVSDLLASDRATAADPRELPKQQAAVTFWLSKKYRIAPEPLSVLVAEAYDLGARIQIEPTLILSVMAIESGFNPFAQSPVGAQGLMQVMTRVHSDKYQSFGGQFAAFDPLANLRVGAKVLSDAIRRNGSIEAGLRAYVGASSPDMDGGYPERVVAEQQRLKQVAQGRSVPWWPTPSPSPAIKPSAAAGLMQTAASAHTDPATAHVALADRSL